MPPPYPTRAMVSAVLWVAFGVALIGGATVELVDSENPQLLVEESGITAGMGFGAALLVLGILILTGVMPGTVGVGTVTLMVVTVTVLPMFLIDVGTDATRLEFGPVQALALLLLATVLLAAVLSLAGGASYRRWRRARRRRS